MSAIQRRLTGGGLGVVLALLALSGSALAQSNAPAKPSSWKFSAAAAVKEAFDDNVFLQSQTGLAERESFVTSLLPQAGVAWNPSPALNAGLTYSPEATWFHSEPSEDFVLHRAVLKLSGGLDQTTYESATTLVLIDGSSVSPTWTGTGGAPAAGGPAIRDRRDATVYRSSLRLTREIKKWLIRPAATFYLHDFQTDHRDPATGYQNSVDRREITGGLDLGRRVSKITAWAGYRYGMQDQARLLQFPEEYDNTFHRILFGLEGAPVSWAKLNLSLGPEYRRFGDQVPTAFKERSRVNVFVDAGLTLLPTKNDTLTLSIKRFQQPGFGGRSVYDDLTGDATYLHKFNRTWTVGFGARAYNTDFLEPVVRNDWVYSGNAFVNWNLTQRLNAEISYTCESGESDVENTAGREYKRHLVALGLKYTFK